MNDILTSLFTRKSVRAYRDTKLEPAVRDLIIESALQAPAAGNQILYTILEIDDKTIKEQLAAYCDNQPFIAKAPLVLVFLADCRKWLDCYRYAGAACREPGFGDAFLAVTDAAIAAQNSVVAAESLGIGSCFIGDILENKEQIVKLLELDKFVFPAAMVVYGYPTDQQKERKKPRRFSKEYVVQKNRYHRRNEEELRSMFENLYITDEKKSFDFDSYLQAFCKRKYMADFSLEMTRSVAAYMENFKKN
ncbi:MAG: nitroreductase family protein [Treponema sp.]|jgi:nitroreductase|nr:nitroreductase family protein [Treponema sp.]